jgi:Flp pilus assembly protein CpaB
MKTPSLSENPRSSTLRTSTQRYRRIWKRLIWHRRKFAALSAAIAMFAIIDVLRPPAPPTTQVLTARHDLLAGSRITSEDVTEVAFPQALAPTELVDAADAVGHTVTAAIPRGAAVTRLSLAGDAWSDLPPGHSAVAVRIQDSGIVGLLTPGQHVRLVAVDPRAPGQAQTVVNNAVILTVPDADNRTTSAQTGRLAVFDVPQEQSGLVVSSAVSRYLTVTWGR